jgi:Domain of unknown function (DUF6484)
MTLPASKRPKLERLAEPSARMTGASVGTVVAFKHGEVRVTFAGTPKPVAARILAPLDDATLERAAHEHAEGVLLFEEGDPARPLLIGLLRSAAPLLDALLAGPLPATEKVARIDGARVAIEGKEEVVLQCGKASLTLRRDGRVVLRGVNLVTQADQVHKIRGGKVQVN